MANDDFADFERKLDRFAKGIQQQYSEGIELAANWLNGEVKDRVFTRGERKNGIDIGQYKSESWKKKRRDRGNQTGFVDLKFSGELMRSIGLAKKNLETSVIINDRKYQSGSSTVEAARGNEKRRGGKNAIFAPSKYETEQVLEIIQDKVNDWIKQTFT